MGLLRAGTFDAQGGTCFTARDGMRQNEG